MSRIPAKDVERLLSSWDAMSTRYLPGRDHAVRFLIDEIRSVGAPVVVDVGCGPASVLARIAAAVPDATLVGIDADPVLVALARRHLARFDPPSRRATIVERSLDDGWPDSVAHAGRADVAIMMLVLHYFSPAEWARVLGDVRRVLRPGGIVAIVESDPSAEPDTSEPIAGPTWTEWWSAIEHVDDDQLQAALRSRRAQHRAASAEHHPRPSELAGLLAGIGYGPATVSRTGSGSYLVLARSNAERCL